MCKIQVKLFHLVMQETNDYDLVPKHIFFFMFNHLDFEFVSLTYE